MKKLPEGIDRIIENPTAYYGKKVTNYKSNENDKNTYRIFYVDKDNYFGDGEYTIYLKADDRYSYNTCNLNNYKSYDSANTKIRMMNPKWAKGKINDSDTKTRGESEDSWNTNEKAVAYLCSPVNEKNYANTLLPWKEYYNSEYANYVIGGPSIEMYVESYNQAYGVVENIANDDTKYPIGADYRSTSYPGYIYTLNGDTSTISKDDYWTGIDSIDYQKYNSMYCGKKIDGTAGKNGLWWIASPCSMDSRYVCVVNGTNASLRCDFEFRDFGISPLVSLKSSFVPEVEE